MVRFDSPLYSKLLLICIFWINLYLWITEQINIKFSRDKLLASIAIARAIFALCQI